MEDFCNWTFFRRINSISLKGYIFIGSVSPKFSLFKDFFNDNGSCLGIMYQFFSSFNIWCILMEHHYWNYISVHTTGSGYFLPHCRTCFLFFTTKVSFLQLQNKTMIEMWLLAKKIVPLALQCAKLFVLQVKRNKFVENFHL